MSGLNRECAYRIDGPFVLTPGFLDFGRTTYVGSRFVYLKESAKFAYGIDDPVLTERLELLHTLEGGDGTKWYPVVVVRRMKTPHESKRDQRSADSVEGISYLSNGRLASAK